VADVHFTDLPAEGVDGVFNMIAGLESERCPVTLSIGNGDGSIQV